MVQTGDKIMLIDTDGDIRLTKGKVYDVDLFDSDDASLPVRVVTDNGVRLWLYERQFRPLSETDELAELRAFRERALSLYSDLAEPETDEAAAERFATAYYDGNDSVAAFMLQAIQWARANPR